MVLNDADAGGYGTVVIGQSVPVNISSELMFFRRRSGSGLKKKVTENTATANPPAALASYILHPSCRTHPAAVHL